MVDSINTSENQALHSMRDYIGNIGIRGAVFNDVLQSYNITQYFYNDPTSSSNAKYLAYTFNYGTGIGKFTNQINHLSKYTKPNQLYTLCMNQIHEGTHALQFHKAASLHTFPNNTSMNIALSPRDYIWQQQLIEKDAYTKEAYMAYYAHNVLNLPISNYNDIYDIFCDILKQEQGNLRNALKSFADQFMQIAEAKENLNFSDKYAWDALYNYQESLHYRQEFYSWLRGYPTTEPLTFVRLSPEDIQNIGSSFEPNVFNANDPCVSAQRPDALPDDLENKVQKLEQELGIDPNSQLPTLDKTLQNMGSTSVIFLQQAISNEIDDPRIAYSKSNTISLTY